MEKKNIGLLVTVTLVAIVIGGVCGYVLANKFFVKNDNSTSQYSTIGTYTLKFNENAPGDIKGSEPSTLTLKNDNTFEFWANMCNGMLKITGNYSSNNHTIVLKNLKAAEGFQNQVELNLRGKDTLEFTIISESEIYLVNTSFGCVLAGNEYGSFIK